MDKAPRQPSASAIVVASGGPRSIERLMACLRNQNIADQLEVMLVSRPEYKAELAQLPADGLCGIQVVDGDFSSSACARVPAILAASAPIVIFCEDHCFPVDAAWAENHLKGHAAGHVAVGPAMYNANPGSACSRTNFAIEYSRWTQFETACETDLIPGHNSSYKRALLLEYSEDLADWLEAEYVLHRDFTKRGLSLLIDPEIRVAHLNVSRLSSTIKLRILESWMFAAYRSAQWSWPRRVFYAAAFPGIFAVRAVRVARIELTAPTPWVTRLSTVPFWLTFLGVAAVGEGLGYLFGPSRKREALANVEYDRWKDIIARDRPLAFGSEWPQV